uniref:Uncharacterized protein n=1 Tax=Acanthochromis polyacanthus TaxID=80966 RepID=A0A3Q1FHC4_9TELE
NPKCSSIHVDVTLKCSTHLNVAAEQTNHILLRKSFQLLKHLMSKGLISICTEADLQIRLFCQLLFSRFKMNFEPHTVRRSLSVAEALRISEREKCPQSSAEKLANIYKMKLLQQCGSDVE